MDAFALADLLERQRTGNGPWLEFLAVPDMSLGLYVLDAGATDPQQPHTEDEAYVILAGRGSFTAAGETRAVAPGDTIFVPAAVPHRFHDITEQLQVIVVFAPREGSRAG
jgi:mannose-6-phosphate isomerase-like protein (cupin superfamily)